MMCHGNCFNSAVRRLLRGAWPNSVNAITAEKRPKNSTTLGLRHPHLIFFKFYRAKQIEQSEPAKYFFWRAVTCCSQFKR